jgi:hypothetical protein
MVAAISSDKLVAWWESCSRGAVIGDLPRHQVGVDTISIQNKEQFNRVVLISSAPGGTRLRCDGHQGRDSITTGG